MTKRNRLIGAVLAIALLICMIPAALAEEVRKDNRITKDDVPTGAFVYTYILTVYHKPTKSSEILEEVPFAKQIVKLKEKDGWAKVMTTNDHIGFCNAKQITEVDPNNLDIYMYCQQKKPEVYKKPSADASVMGHVERNEKIHVVAMTPMCDWLRIEENGYHCYIPRPCLDFEKYEEAELAWVNQEQLTVYYDEKANSKFGTIYFGQEVRLVKRDGVRAKIRSGSGLIGYCDLSGLTTVNPKSLDKKCYTQVDGKYLFTSPSDSGGRRSISANTEMLLDAVDERRFWARVKYEGEYYYVPFVFLDAEPRESGEYKYVFTTGAVSIKEGTKQSSTVVADVGPNTPLLLIGATDYHARVAMEPDATGKRKTGYIEIEYLK